MPDEADETSVRGTSSLPQRRKPKWPRNLLKGLFWAIWVIVKVFDLIDRMSDPPGS